MMVDLAIIVLVLKYWVVFVLVPIGVTIMVYHHFTKNKTNIYIVDKQVVEK